MFVLVPFGDRVKLITSHTTDAWGVRLAWERRKKRAGERQRGLSEASQISTGIGLRASPPSPHQGHLRCQRG